MTPSFLIRTTAVALPLLALAALAPAARAQNTISLIYSFGSDAASANRGSWTQAAVTNQTVSLDSGIESAALNLGNLRYNATGNGLFTRTIDRAVSLSVSGAAITDTLSYSVTGNLASSNTTVGYASAIKTYNLANGGTLRVTLPGGSVTNTGSASATVPVQATFLYTAPTTAAPEPGTIALLLTAGVPVVGIVRRRKTVPGIGN